MTALKTLESEDLFLLDLKGGSMLPNFREGDAVCAVRKPLRDIRFWDVVFFISPFAGNPPILHRAWRKRRMTDGTYRLRTKGDATWKWDPAVRESQILGVGVAVYRDNRSFPLDRGRVRLRQGLQGILGSAWLPLWTLLRPTLQALKNRAAVLAQRWIYRPSSAMAGPGGVFCRRALAWAWCRASSREWIRECLEDPTLL